MRGRPFRKGEGGRPKGTLNRFTELRQALLETFMNMGGAEALAEWASKHKTQFYLMIARMLPNTGMDLPERNLDETLTDEQKDNIAIEYLRGRGWRIERPSDGLSPADKPEE